MTSGATAGGKQGERDADVTDAALQRAIRDSMHDPQAFEPIYRAYAPLVHTYCLRRLADPDQAADAASQVFVNAIRSLPRLRLDDRRMESSFRSWLFAIAHNVVIDAYRRHRSHHSLDATPGSVTTPRQVTDPAPTPEDLALAAESRNDIERAVARLPTRQRRHRTSDDRILTPGNRRGTQPQRGCGALDPVPGILDVKIAPGRIVRRRRDRHGCGGSWMMQTPIFGAGFGRWRQRRAREATLDAFLEHRIVPSHHSTIDVATIDDLLPVIDRALAAPRPTESMSSGDLDAGWARLIHEISEPKPAKLAATATVRGPLRLPEPSVRDTRVSHGAPAQGTRRTGMVHQARIAVVIVVMVLVAGSIPVTLRWTQEEPEQLGFMPAATPEASRNTDGADGPARIVTLEPGEGILPVPSQPPDVFCDVTPRSRDEVLNILGDTAAVDLGDDLETWRVTPLAYDESLDPATFDALQRVFRHYQACAIEGMTFERLALEANYLIRSHVYEPFGRQTTPYSTSTLNEILDGWVEIDGQGSVLANTFEGGDYVLDPAGIRLSGDGTSVEVAVSRGQPVNGIWTVIDHQVAWVQFVLEDGAWRILWPGEYGKG